MLGSLNRIDNVRDDTQCGGGRWVRVRSGAIGKDAALNTEMIMMKEVLKNLLKLFIHV